MLCSQILLACSIRVFAWALSSVKGFNPHGIYAQSQSECILWHTKFWLLCRGAVFVLFNQLIHGFTLWPRLGIESQTFWSLVHPPTNWGQILTIIIPWHNGMSTLWSNHTEDIIDCSLQSQHNVKWHDWVNIYCSWLTSYADFVLTLKVLVMTIDALGHLKTG